MKFKVLSVLLAMFIALPAFALSGREIMEKHDSLEKQKSARSRVVMEIHKSGTKAVKVFDLYNKKINGCDRTLISFLKPTRIRLLTHAAKKGEDAQWLRMTSGRVKRIRGSGKGGSFVRSHFSYRDFEAWEIDDFKYTANGEGVVNGERCYIVDSVRVNGDDDFDLRRIYLRKSDFFIVKVEFLKGKRIVKTMENQDIRTVNKIITPFKIVMKENGSEDRTELKVLKLDYNVDIRDSLFSKSALR